MEQIIVYGRDVEHLLKTNAEECESLSILHRFSYEKYNQRSNYINIPVIILSSAIGFATGIDIGYDNMNIILGIGSIFVGIIKSIDSYFQLQKRAESHRLCSLQYGQINKKIAIELALPRGQRINAKDMLGLIKTDMKNLADIAPLIDKDTINKYNALYTETNVHKPNMVNGLSPVNIRVDTCDLPSNEQPYIAMPSSNAFTKQSVVNSVSPPNLNGMSVSADLVIANLNSSSRRPSLHSNQNIAYSNRPDISSNNTPRLTPSINNGSEFNNDTEPVNGRQIINVNVDPGEM